MKQVKMYIDAGNLIKQTTLAFAGSRKANFRVKLAFVAIAVGFAWAYHKFNDMAVKISVLQREIDNLREED